MCAHSCSSLELMNSNQKLSRASQGWTAGLVALADLCWLDHEGQPWPPGSRLPDPPSRPSWSSGLRSPPGCCEQPAPYSRSTRRSSMPWLDVPESSLHGTHTARCNWQCSHRNTRGRYSGPSWRGCYVEQPPSPMCRGLRETSSFWSLGVKTSLAALKL